MKHKLRSRLLAALTALALALGSAPLSALAADTAPAPDTAPAAQTRTVPDSLEVTLDGQEYDLVLNPDALEARGFFYDVDSGTLTLKGVNETSCSLRAFGDLILVVKGENAVTTTGNDDSIYVTRSLTVQGDGSLRFDCQDDARAIRVAGDFLIDMETGGALEIESATDGISLGGSSFTVTGSGDLSITADNYAVSFSFPSSCVCTIGGREVDRLELSLLQTFTVTGGVYRIPLAKLLLGGVDLLADPKALEEQGVTFDPDSATLTLTDVSFSDAVSGGLSSLYAKGDLVIVANGDNTLGSNALNWGIQMAQSGSLTVTGTGSLTVRGYQNGIRGYSLQVDRSVTFIAACDPKYDAALAVDTLQIGDSVISPLPTGRRVVIQGGELIDQANPLSRLAVCGVDLLADPDALEAQGVFFDPLRGTLTLENASLDYEGNGEAGPIAVAVEGDLSLILEGDSSIRSSGSGIHSSLTADVLTIGGDGSLQLCAKNQSLFFSTVQIDGPADLRLDSEGTDATLVENSFTTLDGREIKELLPGNHTVVLSAGNLTEVNNLPRRLLVGGVDLLAVPQQDWPAGVSYDGKGTLTLTDAAIAAAADSIGIYADGSLTLRLEGESSIDLRGAEPLQYGIYTVHDLTVEGPGALSILTDEFAISCYTLEVDSASTLRLSGANALLCVDGFTIDGAPVPELTQVERLLLLEDGVLTLCYNQPTFLYVDGVDLLTAPQEDWPAGVNYDPTFQTLTLDGATITAPNAQANAAVFTDGDLILQLRGKNFIRCPEVNRGIYLSGGSAADPSTLSLFGDGSLIIDAGSCGIRSEGGIRLSGSAALSVLGGAEALSAGSIEYLPAAGVFSLPVAGPSVGEVTLLAGSDDPGPIDLTASVKNKQYFGIEHYALADAGDGTVDLSGDTEYTLTLELPQGVTLSVEADGRTLEAGVDYVFDPAAGELTLTGSGCRSLRREDGAAGSAQLAVTVLREDVHCARLTAQLRYPETVAVTIAAEPDGALRWTVGGSKPVYDTLYLEKGEEIALAAEVTDPDYAFVGWRTADGTLLSSSPSFSVSFTEDTALTAAANHIYTVVTAVSPAGAGSVSGGGSYAAEASVSLTATAGSGYRFTSWSFSNNVTDAAASGASATFTMPGGDVTATANFEKLYTVNVISPGMGGGTVTARPGTAAAGETVTLTAEAHSGSRFAGWSFPQNVTDIHPLDETSTIFIMPAGDVTVAANFEKLHTITINVLGNGTAGVDPGTAAAGDTVILNATPGPDYHFAGWSSSGGGSFADASSASTTFTMPDGDVTLTANFEGPYTVTASTAGGGTVTANKSTAAAGESITLTATAGSGYRFAGWTFSENITGADVNGMTAGFTMPAGDVTATANFERLYTVTVNSVGGTVTADKTTAAAGETVTLTATAGSGYRFAGWSSSGGGSFADASGATTTFTMPASDTTITALWSHDGSGSGGSATGGSTTGGGTTGSTAAGGTTGSKPTAVGDSSAADSSVPDSGAAAEGAADSSAPAGSSAAASSAGEGVSSVPASGDAAGGGLGGVIALAALIAAAGIGAAVLLLRRRRG